MISSITSSFFNYSEHYNPLTTQLPDDFQDFNPLTIPLSDDSQRSYTVIRTPISEEPALPSPFIDLPSFLNIKEMNAVPEELHENPLFQEYTDPISYEPLFDPVFDRNEPKHIYERASILRWLQVHNTSPLTRKSMTEDDLVPALDLKEKIDKEICDHLLQKHPELLKEYQKKIEETNPAYQKALTYYYEVELPQYERERKLFLVAQECINSSIHVFNESQAPSLKGRISQLSTNSSLISRIGSQALKALDQAFNSPQIQGEKEL